MHTEARDFTIFVKNILLHFFINKKVLDAHINNFPVGLFAEEVNNPNDASIFPSVL